MLSAGVAFQQQLWPIAVSVKPLLEALSTSIHSTSGFPCGSNRRALNPAARRTIHEGMPADRDPSFGDLAQKRPQQRALRP
jgi:hypothetical protein